MNDGEALERVEFGSRVEIELIDEQGNAEAMTFAIVSADAADMARGLLGENTPLARAIMLKPVGSVVPYEMDDIRNVRILSARKVREIAPPDAARRRQAVLDRAREAAERTNAEMFAASFSGKWGGYEMTDGGD